jgi:Tfp pilus assembly protein PilN
VSAPLNLARRPFRNERLPTLLLAVAGVALAAATVRHAVVAWDLLPGRARDVESQVVGLETEATRLRAEAAGLQELAAPPAALAEWMAVKGLVDRRAFSWTGLFSALEQALPAGVQLVSVAPQEGESGMELSLAAQGRSGEDALALLKSLQVHGEFEGAFLNGWTDGREGVDISCTVRYQPRRPAGGGR